LALQVAAPFATAGQSSFTQQLALVMHCVPHFLYPVAQVKPQARAVPTSSHVAWPFAGMGQGVQLAPHELMLASARHWPPHSCVPGAHSFMHCWDVGMHAPAQRNSPVGQVAPQAWPSHVAATAPAGLGQGVHDVPQWAGWSLATHWPLHRW
jgi:hypothetical protein